MNILLDIDGVLVTTPSWKPTENLDDNFPDFKFKAVESLNQILNETNAKIILTTTHKHRFDTMQWKNIFVRRGVNLISIDKIRNVFGNRLNITRYNEVVTWINNNPRKKYVIIDDDKSLNSLPYTIKNHLVLVDSLIGLTESDAESAIRILLDTERQEDFVTDY